METVVSPDPATRTLIKLSPKDMPWRVEKTSKLHNDPPTPPKEEKRYPRTPHNRCWEEPAFAQSNYTRHPCAIGKGKNTVAPPIHKLTNLQTSSAKPRYHHTEATTVTLPPPDTSPERTSTWAHLPGACISWI